MASASSWVDAKTAGNAEYMSGNTQRAIELYTEALAATGVPAPPADRATLLSNRAQCHLKLNAHAAAAEDCTAALALAPGHVKALFRRAAALEASRSHRAALADYRAVLAQQPEMNDALAGVRRCQIALGESPTASRPAAGKQVAAPAAPTSAPPPAPPQQVLSSEDRRNLEEAQTRVKDVYRQKLRATEQLKVANQEKRRAELTLSQLASVPADGGDEAALRLFRGVGRMFVRTPKDDIVRDLMAAAAKSEQRLKVCINTVEYLTKSLAESEASFLETTTQIRNRRQ